jgi:hypothetical protein
MSSAVSTAWSTFIAGAIQGQPDEPFLRLLRSRLASGDSPDAPAVRVAKVGVKAMGLAWVDLGAGYWRLTGGLFTLHVVEIDVVADEPDEDLLASPPMDRSLAPYEPGRRLRSIGASPV